MGETGRYVTLNETELGDVFVITDAVDHTIKIYNLTNTIINIFTM